MKLNKKDLKYLCEENARRNQEAIKEDEAYQEYVAEVERDFYQEITNDLMNENRPVEEK